MRFAFLFLLTVLVQIPAVQAGEGLITKESQYSVAETLDRLEATLEDKGVAVALRWNHAGKAEAVDIPLRDTELLVFGNPALGSHVFTSNQTAGIDLPMKALAWEDADGKVWLTYNDPRYIAERHDIEDRPDVIRKMTHALDRMTAAATGSGGN